MNDFVATFAAFLAKADAEPPFVVQRRDFRFEHTEVYLRIGPRLIEGEVARCLQIANIETASTYRGQGSFERFLIAARLLTDLPFYVENSSNPRFTAALIKHGFTAVKTTSQASPDLYRLT